MFNRLRFGDIDPLINFFLATNEEVV
jgi:hypothetical protein